MYSKDKLVIQEKYWRRKKLGKSTGEGRSSSLCIESFGACTIKKESKMKRAKSRRVRRRNRISVLLPRNLIIQILLRLPVKSLARFKSVCKSWFSVISDPHFAISHFELAAACTERLLFLGPTVHEVRSIDFNAPLNDDSASAALNLNFLSPESHSDLIHCLCFWTVAKVCVCGIPQQVSTNKCVSHLLHRIWMPGFSCFSMVLVMTLQQMTTWWCKPPTTLTQKLQPEWSFSLSELMRGKKLRAFICLA